MHELFNLSDDVAIVTGAGRGIGEGIATTLADAGAAVVCAARRLDEIERVAAGIRARGGKAIAVATDVTDNRAVEALAAAAAREFGHLEICGPPAASPKVGATAQTRATTCERCPAPRRSPTASRVGAPLHMSAAG